MLTVPRMTRQEAAAGRIRHAPRAELRLGPELRLRLAPPDGRACGPEPVRVALRWGEHDLAVHCPAELVRDALRALDPELAPFGAWAPDLAGLLLELALIDLVRLWERASGRSVTLTGAVLDAGPPADGLALSVGARDGAVYCRAHLACTDAQADAVLAAWPVQPRELAWMTLPAVLRLGATRLTRAMLGSLRPGDAVLLEHRAAVLVVAERWAAGAVMAQEQWTLSEAPRPAGDHRGDWTMSEPQGDGAPAADPDDLPVLLTFEVGRLAVELGQLRRFGPGSVIELPRRHPLVEIAAHGRRVGEGELVEVDGAVGVRITRLFDHAE